MRDDKHVAPCMDIMHLDTRACNFDSQVCDCGQ